MYLEEIKKTIHRIEEKSPVLSSPYGAYPSKGGDGGDDCLWNGLLASTGDNKGFTQVIHSQAILHEKRAGMWYRNPLRRSNDNEGHSHYFSRDMSLGVLLALASDNYAWMWDRANLWLNYIDHNRACAVKKPKWAGGGCLVRSPMYRFAPDDDRSNITPTMWALMGRVWEYNQWPMHSCMKKYKGADGDVSVESAKIVPLGYQLHLLAVQAYLKIILGQSYAMRSKVAKICYERQPDNLFYKLVSQEKAFRSDCVLFLERCPDPDTFTPADYWLWEKSVMDPKKSCGWDWVFLGKLLLKLS